MPVGRRTINDAATPVARSAPGPGLSRHNDVAVASIPSRSPIGAGVYRADKHEGDHHEQRFGAAAQAAEWDKRYRERDGVM